MYLLKKKNECTTTTSDYIYEPPYPILLFKPRQQIYIYIYPHGPKLFIYVRKKKKKKIGPAVYYLYDQLRILLRGCFSSLSLSFFPSLARGDRRVGKYLTPIRDVRQHLC